MRTLPLTLLATGLLFSAAKPNFSGTWKLNLDKSDFGRAPVPKSMTTRVEHRESEMKVHSEIAGPQGDYTTDYAWVVDGRENTNTIRGAEVRASVVWNGGALVSNAKTRVNGVALNVIDTWTLSQDGRILTVSRTIVAPQGNAEMTFVYEK